MEAWRCLLQAACAGSVPADVYFALGNLHYLWGDLLDSGRRAELGAEGAARSVVADIKELRKQALRKRQRSPASRSTKPTPGGFTAKQTDGPSINAGGTFPAASRRDEKSLPEVDHPQAWEWYIKAAEHGDTRAMIQLGDIAMEATKKHAVNAQHAEEWYLKASAGDPPQPEALFQLARIRHEGIGVPSDPARARGMYEEACEAGSSAAAYFLGQRLHAGDEELGIEADGARALQLLSRSAEQGHAEAMFYLAQAHRSGSPEMGVPQDLQKFGEMVQQAAAAGSADAMFALGGTFFHGVDGFARDPRAAFRCYSRAADLGHGDASYCLGVMHYTMGSKEEAFRCYQTAAEGGTMIAWRNLASMYALGEGVARSEQMAKSILETLGDQIEKQEGNLGGDKEDKS
ncbi:unnamed protein product [Laminaria digitata]